MSFSSDKATLVNQLPLSVDFPKDFDKFLETITNLYKRIADAVNTKEASLYSLQELGNFQQYYTPANPQVFRNVYRKVIQITALVAGANNFAHGLTITGFTFTHIYGAIQDGTPTLAAPIPQGEPAAGNRAVSVQVNATNVVVTISAGSPYIGFTGNVVLEYTKN